MPKFGFISWDWKGSPEIDELNDLLAPHKFPMLTDLSDEIGSDSHIVAVHSRENKLSADEWVSIYDLLEGEGEEEIVAEFADKIDVVEDQLGHHVKEMSHKDFTALVKALRGLGETPGDHSTTTKTIPITNPVIVQGRKKQTFVVTEDMLKERLF